MSFPFLQPYAGLGNSLQTAQASVGGAGGIGGWVELGRTTLGGTSSTITVSSLADKRYYMVLGTNIANSGGGTDASLRLGNSSVDTGSNYASRISENGGGESIATNRTNIRLNSSGASRHEFDIVYIANLSGKEKLVQGNSLINWVSGAGGDVHRKEIVGKWANTSNPIDVIQRYFTSGAAQSGDEVVVLGWDPADTHTTNFWEELASVEWSSGGTIDTGAFTAKKYLWVQVQFKGNSGVYTRFNSDSGSNYMWRYNNNGGSDTTQTSITGIHSNFGFDTNPHFVNMFIINNASNEKLVMSHLVTQNTAGAGNVSSRQEASHKWANTSSQITSMQLVTGSGNFTGGLIKVWGSD